MARQQRQFYECTEMADILEEITQKYGSSMGEEYVDPSDIWCALIAGNKPKNSQDVYIDKNSKQWVQKHTKKLFCLAVWDEKWDSWSKQKKEWKVFESLLQIAKIKPDIVGHSCVFELLGWNWELEADIGNVLPELLSDEVSEKMALPGQETEEEEEVEEIREQPKVKLLKQN